MTWDGLSEITGELDAGGAGAAHQVGLDLLVTLVRPVRRIFSGRPDQVARARDFVRRRLGLVPVVDEIVLLVSELCTNALLHTASGDSGTFEVMIYLGVGWVRVGVFDNGSSQVPVLSRADVLSEDGRGLALVELIADSWGYDEDHRGRLVYFDLHWTDTA